jgi:hypothetical protein
MPEREPTIIASPTDTLTTRTLGHTRNFISRDEILVDFLIGHDDNDAWRRRSIKGV